MKNLLLISAFIIVSIFSTSVFAQSGKFFIGANAGIGPSSAFYISGGGIGYSGNIGVKYNVTNHFSLVSGIGFEQKNATELPAFYFTGEQLYPLDYSIIHSFNFIQIPVLVRAEIGRKVKYFFNIGPYFSYLTNQYISVFDENDNLLSKNIYTNNFNRFVTGISFGAGFNIPVSDKINLNSELLFGQDKTNLSKTEGIPIKTGYIFLIVGVNYCFGN